MTNDKYQISPVVLQSKTGHGGFANAKLIVPLLMLVLVMAFGCQKVDKPVRGEEAEEGKLVIVVDLAPEDAPESHKNSTNYAGDTLKTSAFTSSSLEGLDYWQAYHPVLITGTENPVLKADPDEECLSCHYDPDTACNVCHSYVGAKRVTSVE